MEVKLKDSDMTKMNNLNEKNKWAISKEEIIELTRKHKIANEYDKALIEYRLTDINFHTYVGLLYHRKYEELEKLIEEDFE
ncbi:hypothetical protein [Dysgonomonas sp. 25]|uniref:hypothetical protein n=1 Tax=Dysgonomonas sp. 25 TaxID=2302933 RepID=UPI0013D3C065|nr:hypothetical protein [Dysgonomonas sp. 25]NDV68633.1 hypothetical protein [Dysgonomonas sp. 25]